MCNGNSEVLQPDFLSQIRKDRRWLVGVTLGGLALLGVTIAALATHVHYHTIASEGGYRSFCTLSDKVDCTAVVLTPQSRILGIPISIFGFFTYLIIFGLQVKGQWKGDLDFARSLALTTLISLGCALYSIYLAYIVVFVVQRHCVLCYGLYAVNLALLLFGLLFAWRWRVSFISVLVLEVQSVLGNRPVAIGSGLLLVVCVIGAFVLRNTQRNLFIHRNPILLAIFDNSAQRVRLPLQNVPTWGPDEAEVTVIEFNDFQCPFCRQSVKTLEQVVKEFPNRIRRRFVDLPLDKDCNPFVPYSLHEGSCRLAVAGRVAYAKGKFWEFHERAFDHVGQWSDETLVAILAGLGIPEEEAPNLLADEAAHISVENEIRIAHHLGIRVTPSFVVNGMLVEGNLDPWLWERIIRLEIERAEARRRRLQPTPAPAHPELPPTFSGPGESLDSRGTANSTGEPD